MMWLSITTYKKKHRSAVLRIIRKLADARLQLDFDKSEFEGGIIKYLGYLIETGRGLRAIIRCICEWRTEFVGQHFEVWSDHRNLAYF